MKFTSLSIFATVVAFASQALASPAPPLPTKIPTVICTYNYT